MNGVRERAQEVYPYLGNLAGLNPYQSGTLALSVLLLLTAPMWGSNLLYPLALANVWAILAMSWDIISGHSGYFSFGHTLLSGTAAYTTAILTYTVNPEMSLWITLPLSLLAALVVGLVISLPSLRLQGPYFSLVTLVAVLVAERFVYIFSEYTNGEQGITSVSVLTYDTVELYYITLGAMVIVAIPLVFISRTNIGRTLIAIRENEAAVEEAGLDTAKFKLTGFVISTLAMGFGGVMIAHFYGAVLPSNVLTINLSIILIAMVLVGGMGTVVGPIVGAYLLILLRDWLLSIWFDSTLLNLVLWIVILALILSVREGLFTAAWERLDQLSEEGR